jgi:hypothetical protein
LLVLEDLVVEVMGQTLPDRLAELEYQTQVVVAVERLGKLVGKQAVQAAPA